MLSTTAFGPGVCPPEVLDGLRRIDPAAELIHLGGDEWWLGVRAPNQEANDALSNELKATARLILDSASDPLIANQESKRLRMLDFMAKGFKPVALYKIQVPDQTVVDDFQMRDFNWRYRREAAHREFKEAVSLEGRDRWRGEVFDEYIDQETGSWYRHALKRAKGFVVGAINFGRRR